MNTRKQKVACHKKLHHSWSTHQTNKITKVTERAAITYLKRGYQFFIKEKQKKNVIRKGLMK